MARGGSVTGGGRVFVVAAGGTGGHLFAGEALAGALMADGHSVHLITDGRGEQYAKAFKAGNIHVVRSDTIRGGSPIALLITFLRLGLGFLASLGLMLRIRPDAVIGFGGYPSMPPVFAAWFSRIPTAIHEQNAVMGRANRLLSRFVRAIAASFPDAAYLDGKVRAKMTVTGNPVRQHVIDAVKPYKAPEADGPLRLVVFGGSQGARVMSDVVPGALAGLGEESLKNRLQVVQQCREEDLVRVEAIYRKAGIAAELDAFFTDLPALLSDAHLVISRSGASSVAELAVLGRPSILVPLKHSLDQDQKANAGLLVEPGGAVMIVQDEFTPAHLSIIVTELLRDPARLSHMAASAKNAVHADAASRLKDFALRLL